MIAYTIQLSQWRRAKAQGILVLDTTVRTGDKVFAPSWDIVTQIKANVITPEQYTVVYKRMMVESLRNHTARWSEVIRGEPVAIACYCSKDKFCHRHLLCGYFRELCLARNIPFEYRGEL